LWESFVDDFKTFTKDILNNLGKDRLKRIRDYLRENSVFVQKEVRKSIVEGLLATIHEPNLLKWPTADPTADNSTRDNSTTDDPSLNDPSPNDPSPNEPTPNDPTLTLA
jgi:hypothetical protein